MTKRNVIVIDEAQCNGCGLCIPNCPEGALQVIDGKARLVGELLCDGLGACIGHCPEGAMRVEERDVEAYDEMKVMDNVVRGGEAVIRAHLKHLHDHGQDEYFKRAKEYLQKNGIPLPKEDASRGVPPSGCPGTMIRDFREEQEDESEKETTVTLRSELRQWPIQLQLLSPHAPYFKDADLVIAADCVPFTFADFHRRFLQGKTLIIFCPKLDSVLDSYREKLTAIIRENNIKSISVAHMEVPCCFGTVRLVQDAIRASGKNLEMKEYTISIKGGVK